MEKQTPEPDSTKKSLGLTRREFLRNAALAAGGVAATAALNACVPVTAPPPAPVTGATTAPVAVPTIIVKQKPVVVLQGVDPEGLDPHFGESGISANVYFNMLEALVQYDRKMQLQPLLCESYGVLDDKVTWRFKLRQGVKFWNGEPFNADAVKFTVERTMNADLRKQGLNDPFPSRTGVQKVNIQDPYTVDIVLKDPNIIMPVYTYFLYILEPKYYSTHTPAQTVLAPMGTGPWMFKEWVKGDHLTLEANPNYWRGAPPIQTLIYKPVPEKSTKLNLLLAGDADVVSGLNPDDIPTLKGASNVRASIAPGSRRVHIGIPTQIARYKDRRVRQAFRYAIDWDSLNKGLMGGLAAHRASVLVSGQDWLPADMKPWAYDPAKAKSLLADAKFPTDQPIKIYVPAGRYLKGEDAALAVAGQLRSIGLKADAQILDWQVYSDKMRAENGGLDDLYVLGLGSRFNGPEDVSIVTTDQIWDQTGWIKNTENGPKFQALYKQLAATFDDKQQHAVVGQMLQLFDEESTWIHLWLEPAVSGASKCTSWEDFGGGGNLMLWPPSSDPVKFTC